MCRLLFGEGVVKRPEAPCHYQIWPHPDHSKGWGQSSLGARKNSWGWGESSLSRGLLLAFKFPNNTTLAIRITGLDINIPSEKLAFLSVTKGYLITQRCLYNPMSLKWRTYTMHCIASVFLLHIHSRQDTDLPWILLSLPYLPHAAVKLRHSLSPSPTYFQNWTTATDSWLASSITVLSLQRSEGGDKGTALWTWPPPWSQSSLLRPQMCHVTSQVLGYLIYKSEVITLHSWQDYQGLIT